MAGARHSPETQQRCSDVRVHPLPSPSPSTRAPTVLPSSRSWPGIITGQTAPFLFPPRLELRTSRSTGSTGSLRCYLQIRGEAYNENLSSPRCVIVTTCWTTEENESSRLKVFEFRDRKPERGFRINFSELERIHWKSRSVNLLIIENFREFQGMERKFHFVTRFRANIYRRSFSLLERRRSIFARSPGIGEF